MPQTYAAGIVVAVTASLGALFGRELIHEGAAAPSFELRDTAGKAFSTRDIAGRAALMLFVRPEQERSVLALRDAMLVRHDVPGTAWEICAIVSGAFTESAIAALCTKAGFTGRVLKDADMQVYGTCGVIVTPSTVLIGRDGKVAFSKAGYDFEFESAVRAYLQWSLGQIDVAARDAQVARARTGQGVPSKAARLLGLAHSMRAKGELASAEQLVHQALAEAPDSLPARVELAEIRIAQDRPAEALTALQEAPAGVPRSGPFHLACGRALAATDKLADAEREFLEAVKTDPRAGQAHYELGKLYERQGKLELAVKELKLAVEKLLAHQP